MYNMEHKKIIRIIIITLIVIIIIKYRIIEFIPINFSRYDIENDEIYQFDLYNKIEYSRFNIKTKECVRWYAHQMSNELLNLNQNSKVLVLGVGLGGIIVELSNKRPDLVITGVDISDINSDIVMKYGNTKKIKLIKQDANDYISESNEMYDGIICDLFDSIYVPEFVFTFIFLNKINNMLNKNGKFIINVPECNIEKLKPLLDESFPNNSYQLKKEFFEKRPYQNILGIVIKNN